MDVGVGWVFEADHKMFAGCQSALHLFCRQSERVYHAHAGVGVVLEGFLLVFSFLAFSIQLLGSVEGIVGPAVVDQLLGVGLVEGFALGLFVRTVLAADADALVKGDTEPLEGFDDVFLSAFHEAGLVGVFNSQQESAVVFLGKQVVVQCGAHAAYV